MEGNEWLIENDRKGNTRGTILGILPVFTWMDSEGPQKLS
jgi:hypothetical protein